MSWVSHPRKYTRWLTVEKYKIITVLYDIKSNFISELEKLSVHYYWHFIFYIVCFFNHFSLANLPQHKDYHTILCGLAYFLRYFLAIVIIFVIVITSYIIPASGHYFVLSKNNFIYESVSSNNVILGDYTRLSIFLKPTSSIFLMFSINCFLETDKQYIWHDFFDNLWNVPILLWSSYLYQKRKPLQK